MRADRGGAIQPVDADIRIEKVDRSALPAIEQMPGEVALFDLALFSGEGLEARDGTDGRQKRVAARLPTIVPARRPHDEVRRTIAVLRAFSRRIVAAV